MSRTPPIVRAMLRTTRDGGVVVASILVAFALEAWWGERQLTRDVQADLSNVASQLLSEEQRIRSSMQRVARVLDAGSEMLAQLEGQPEGALAPVSDTLLWWALRARPTVEVSMGSVTALIASGRIGAVQDADLRVRLGSLQSQIDDVTEDQEALRQHDLGEFASVLSAHFDQVHLDQISLAARGVGSPPGDGGQALPSFGSVGIPNLLAIRNGVRIRLGLLRRSSQAMERLREELRLVRGMIIAD